VSSNIKYRPDIDGLRAIAVSVVVFFHAGITSLAGGFVGVDVFFVISGFLITTLLVKEAQNTGTISLSNFYARRIRRLMPAGLFVVLSVLLVGLFIFPADVTRQNLALSAIASTAFVSNFYFWRTTGYFAPNAEDIPLLHTWTLSVEEQFYVFWPILIIAILWASRKFKWDFRLILSLSFLGVCLVSFALAQWMLGTRPSAAFYLVISRAFELGAGALLALYLPDFNSENKVFGTGLSLCGLVAIIYAVLVFDERTLWPGPSSLIVVFGTIALLAGGKINTSGLVSRFLSTSPITFMGKMSYSWYLWHWPLLVFLNYVTFGEAALSQKMIAVALSLGLAIFSYYIVEKPIRFARTGAFSHIKGSLIGGSAMILGTIVVAFGVLTYSQGELKNSDVLQSAKLAQTKTFPMRAECVHYQTIFSGLDDWQKCLLPQTAPPPKDKGVIVFGDSHSIVMRALFDDLSKKANIGPFLLRAKAGCRPFDGAYNMIVNGSEILRQSCVSFTKAVQDEFQELSQKGFREVLLISRWPPSGTTGAKTELWIDELGHTIARAQAAGLKVNILSGVPLMHRHVPKCIARKLGNACDTPREIAELIYNAQMEGLRRVSEVSEAKIIDLFNILCDDVSCKARLDDGTLLYRDDNHLSYEGMRYIYPYFAQKLR